MAHVLHDGANELKAERCQDEEYPEDLASAALGEPSLEPRKNHLHQHEVEEDKREEDDECPGEKEWTSHGGPQQCAYHEDGAESARGVEISIDQPNQKIRPVGDRKAKQFRGIGIIGKGRGHDGEELPEQENGPQNRCQKFRFVLRN